MIQVKMKFAKNYYLSQKRKLEYSTIDENTFYYAEDTLLCTLYMKIAQD